MELLGRSEDCAEDGCGHPERDHVSDKMLHQGVLSVVHRCIACEREGGPCTDSARILADEPEDEAQAS